MRKLYNDFFHIPENEKIKEKVMMMRVVLTVVVMVGCLVAMGITAYAYFSYSVTSHFGAIRAANFETNVSVQTVGEVQTAAEETTPVAEETTSVATTEPTPVATQSVEAVATSEPISELVPVITSDHKAHKVTGLKAGKTYLVTISPTDNNTAENGFVIFAAYHTDTSGESSLVSSVYHTQQLGIDIAAENERTDVISFYLTLAADADVIFYSHWGTSSYYGYENDVQQPDGEETEQPDLYVEQGETVNIAVTGAENLEDDLMATPTPIPELTPSPTPMPEVTPTPGPEATGTPAPTGEPIATEEPTVTAAPTETSAPEATIEPTSEPTAPETPEASATAAPDPSATSAPSATVAPEAISLPIEPVTTTEPTESSAGETTT